jgi:hypothetical protein
MALSRARLPDGDFAQAKSAVLAALTDPALTGYETVAVHAAPEHPSWLGPFGNLTRQLAATREDAEARLRQIARGPLRLAMLADHSAQQGEIAARSFERWLAIGDGPCAASSTTAPRAGDHRRPASGAIGRLWIAAVSPSKEGWRAAELVARAIDGDDGSLAKAVAAGQGPVKSAVRWVGGRRAPTLMIEIVAPVDAIDAELTLAKAALAELHKNGMPPEALARAAEAVKRDRVVRLRDPRKRLESLWLGGDDRVATGDEARAWLAKTLAPGNLVTLVEGP